MSGEEKPTYTVESNRRKDVIPVSRVNKAIDLLGSNLKIPQERLQMAEKSQVFLVDKNTFYDIVSEHVEQLGFRIPKELEIKNEDKNKAEAIYLALGTSVEEVREKKRKLVEGFYSQYSMIEGISICNKNGEKSIFINGDEVDEEKIDDILSHELLHAMVDTVNEGSGFNTEYGRYHFLNEAAVQLMALRSKYNFLDWKKFSDAVKKGDIENDAYSNQVNALLVLFEATTFGKGEYSFEDLKDLYFDMEMDSGTKAVFLKMSLFSRIPEKIGVNEKMRDNLLYIFETRLEKVTGKIRRVV